MRDSIDRRVFLGVAGGVAWSATYGSATRGSASERPNSPPDKTASREIGANKVLFVDRDFIERSDGVELTLHPPRKTNERLIESEHPWESATLNWFSVLKDEGKYRMWYECYDVDGWPTADDTSFCYAESTDGQHWIKPHLGLVEYRGSKQNNILFRQIGRDAHRSRVHGNCVFIDPTAPPESRYKCVSQGLFQGIGDRPYYVAGMTSPDGLHWTRLPRPICPVFADSQYSAFWDPSQQTYVLYGRASGRGGRAIGRACSPNFNTFPRLTDDCVLEVEPDDPLPCDLYNPACQPYPGVPGTYLMFPSLFRHRDDTLEIRLAVSRGGAHWSWPARSTTFLGLGAPGAWDGGSLYMGNGACVPTGDDFSFYFSGSTLKHQEVDLPKLVVPANRRVISRAVARRDRLVSATAAEREGTLQTHLAQYQGQRLVLNARVRPSGIIRVGLTTENGDAIPGFSLGECRPIQTDDVSLPVSWSGNANLNKVLERPLRLQFELRNADLFSLWFEPIPPE